MQDAAVQAAGGLLQGDGAAAVEARPQMQGESVREQIGAESRCIAEKPSPLRRTTTAAADGPEFEAQQAEWRQQVHTLNEELFEARRLLRERDESFQEFRAAAEAREAAQFQAALEAAEMAQAVVASSLL